MKRVDFSGKDGTISRQARLLELLAPGIGSDKAEILIASRIQIAKKLYEQGTERGIDNRKKINSKLSEAWKAAKGSSKKDQYASLIVETFLTCGLPEGALEILGDLTKQGDLKVLTELVSDLEKNEKYLNLDLGKYKNFIKKKSGQKGPSNSAKAAKRGTSDIDYIYEIIEIIGSQNIQLMCQHVSQELMIRFVKLASPEYVAGLITEKNILPETLAANIETASPKVLYEALKKNLLLTSRILSSLKTGPNPGTAGTYLKWATPEKAFISFEANSTGIAKAVKATSPEYIGRATSALGADISDPEVLAVVSKMFDELGLPDAPEFLENGGMDAVSFYKLSPEVTELAACLGGKNAGLAVKTMSKKGLEVGFVPIITDFAKKAGKQRCGEFIEHAGLDEAVTIMCSLASSKAADYINAHGSLELGGLTKAKGVDDIILMLEKQTPRGVVNSDIFSRLAAQVSDAEATAYVNAGGVPDNNPQTVALINNYGGKIAGQIACALEVQAENRTAKTPDTIDLFNNFAENVERDAARRLAKTLGIHDYVKIVISPVAKVACEIVCLIGAPGFVKMSNGLEGQIIGVLETNRSTIVNELKMKGVDEVIKKHSSTAPIIRQEKIENIDITHSLSSLFMTLSQGYDPEGKAFEILCIAYLENPEKVEEAFTSSGAKTAVLSEVKNTMTSLADAKIAVSRESISCARSLIASGIEVTDRNMNAIGQLAEASGFDSRIVIDLLSVQDTLDIVNSPEFERIKAIIGSIGLDSFIEFRNGMGGIRPAIDVIKQDSDIQSKLKEPGGVDKLIAEWYSRRYSYIGQFSDLAGKPKADMVIRSLGPEALNDIFSIASVEKVAMLVNADPMGFVNYVTGMPLEIAAENIRDLPAASLAGEIRKLGVINAGLITPKPLILAGGSTETGFESCNKQPIENLLSAVSLGGENGSKAIIALVERYIENKNEVLGASAGDASAAQLVTLIGRLAKNLKEETIEFINKTVSENNGNLDSIIKACEAKLKGTKAKAKELEPKKAKADVKTGKAVIQTLDAKEIIRLSGLSFMELTRMMQNSPKNWNETPLLLLNVESFASRKEGVTDSDIEIIAKQVFEKLNLIKLAAEALYPRGCRLPSKYDSDDQYQMLYDLAPDNIEIRDLDAALFMPAGANYASEKAKKMQGGSFKETKTSDLPLALKDPSTRDSKAYVVTGDNKVISEIHKGAVKVNVLIVETKKAEKAKPRNSGNKTILEILLEVPLGQLSEAKKLMVSGKPPEALKLIDSTIKNYEKNSWSKEKILSPAWKLKGDIFFEIGTNEKDPVKLENAVNYYENSFNLLQNPELLSRQGDAYSIWASLETGKEKKLEEKAINCFSEAIKLDAGYPEKWVEKNEKERLNGPNTEEIWRMRSATLSRTFVNGIQDEKDLEVLKELQMLTMQVSVNAPVPAVEKTSQKEQNGSDASKKENSHAKPNPEDIGLVEEYPDGSKVVYSKQAAEELTKFEQAADSIEKIINSAEFGVYCHVNEYKNPQGNQILYIKDIILPEKILIDTGGGNASSWTLKDGLKDLGKVNLADKALGNDYDMIIAGTSHTTNFNVFSITRYIVTEKYKSRIKEKSNLFIHSHSQFGGKVTREQAAHISIGDALRFLEDGIEFFGLRSTGTTRIFSVKSVTGKTTKELSEEISESLGLKSLSPKDVEDKSLNNLKKIPELSDPNKRSEVLNELVKEVEKTINRENEALGNIKNDLDRKAAEIWINVIKDDLIDIRRAYEIVSKEYNWQNITLFVSTLGNVKEYLDPETSERILSITQGLKESDVSQKLNDLVKEKFHIGDDTIYFKTPNRKDDPKTIDGVATELAESQARIPLGKIYATGLGSENEPFVVTRAMLENTGKDEKEWPTIAKDVIDLVIEIRSRKDVTDYLQLEKLEFGDISIEARKALLHEEAINFWDDPTDSGRETLYYLRSLLAESLGNYKTVDSSLNVIISRNHFLYEFAKEENKKSALAKFAKFAGYLGDARVRMMRGTGPIIAATHEEISQYEHILKTAPESCEDETQIIIQSLGIAKETVLTLALRFAENNQDVSEENLLIAAAPTLDENLELLKELESLLKKRLKNFEQTDGSVLSSGQKELIKGGSCILDHAYVVPIKKDESGQVYVTLGDKTTLIISNGKDVPIALFYPEKDSPGDTNIVQIEVSNEKGIHYLNMSLETYGKFFPSNLTVDSKITPLTPSENGERFDKEMFLRGIFAVLSSAEGVKMPSAIYGAVTAGTLDVTHADYVSWVEKQMLTKASEVFGKKPDVKGLRIANGYGRCFHGMEDRIIHSYVNLAAVSPEMGSLAKELEELNIGVNDEQVNDLRNVLRIAITLEESAAHGHTRAISNSLLKDAFGHVITEADKFIEAFVHLACIEIAEKMRDEAYKNKNIPSSELAFYDALVVVVKNLDDIIPLYSIGTRSENYLNQRRDLAKLMNEKGWATWQEAYFELLKLNVIDTKILDEDLVPIGSIPEEKSIDHSKAFSELDELNTKLIELCKEGRFYPERMVAQVAVTAAYSDDQHISLYAEKILFSLCSEGHLSKEDILGTLIKIPQILPG